MLTLTRTMTNTSIQPWLLTLKPSLDNKRIFIFPWTCFFSGKAPDNLPTGEPPARSCHHPGMLASLRQLSPSLHPPGSSASQTDGPSGNAVRSHPVVKLQGSAGRLANFQRVLSFRCHQEKTYLANPHWCPVRCHRPCCSVRSPASAASSVTSPTLSPFKSQPPLACCGCLLSYS